MHEQHEMSDKMKRDLAWIVEADGELAVRYIHLATLRSLKRRGFVEYKAENPWERINPTEAGRMVVRLYSK